MINNEKIMCSKCKKTLSPTSFFTRKDGSKADMCKKCMGMHVDSAKPETFLWILKKMDVPYIPTEWKSVYVKEMQKKGDKFSNAVVLGKYLSQMKLKQHIQYTWDDTERLQEDEKERLASLEKNEQEYEKELRAQFEAGTISEAEYKTLTDDVVRNLADIERRREMATAYVKDGIVVDEEYIPEEVRQAADQFGVLNEDSFMPLDAIPDMGEKLTDEDKVYLLTKWGRNYTCNDWVSLEQDYNKMAERIQDVDPDTEKSLKLVCKTYLKMDKALDDNDYETYTKLNRTYESLRKTGAMTKIQEKKKETEVLDSVGALINMCEKDGFIPTYAIDVPKDNIDYVLMDMKQYLNRLISVDLGFADQLTRALKRIEESGGKKDILEVDSGEELSIEDLFSYNTSIDELNKQDDEYLDELIEEM